MPCRAPGCVHRTTGWSGYCSTHKSRLRRHGHPTQQGVTKKALQPYLNRLQTVRDRNPDSPLWLLLEERWEGFVGGCAAREQGYLAGQVVQRNQIQAAREIVRLGQEVSSARVIDTVAAMMLMSRWEPGRFRADVALFHQVARRVRGLSHTSAATRYDHRLGKVRKVYREIPPKTALILGRWLVEAFGALGVWVHGIEQEAERAAQKRVTAINQAMRELKWT